MLAQRARENLLASVVADRVEPALRPQPHAEIAVGRNDPLLVVQRAGDHLAHSRLDDRGATLLTPIVVQQLSEAELLEIVPEIDGIASYHVEQVSEEALVHALGIDNLSFMARTTSGGGGMFMPGGTPGRPAGGAVDGAPSP